MKTFLIQNEMIYSLELIRKSIKTNHKETLMATVRPCLPTDGVLRSFWRRMETLREGRELVEGF